MCDVLLPFAFFRCRKKKELMFQSGADAVYSSCHRRNWVAFWILGLINNFHYCLVLSAADDIASSFGLKSYVALVSWANVVFGVVVRLLNAFVYTNVPYHKRYLIAGIQTITGIILVSIAKFLGSNDWIRFLVALVGVVFCGNGSTYGESVSLGFLERFPSRTVGGWSSGTGMSGVLASLVYLGLVACGLSNNLIFIISAPLVLMFWCVYFLVIVQPAVDLNGDLCIANSLKLATTDGLNPIAVSSTTEDVETLDVPDDEDLLLNDEIPKSPWLLSSIIGIVAPSAANNLEQWRNRNWDATRAIHALTFSNNLNLLIVYVAEYAVQFMAPFSFPCEMVKHGSSFWITNSFVVTQFCYQIGVLISRSSLMCVRIRRVSIISAVQVLNALFWFTQAKLQFVGDSSSETREERFAFILFGYMVVVGLCGGASYVNVFFNILESPKQTNLRGLRDEREWRQLSMNIGALYAISGISLGSILDVVFSNTVLTNSC